MTACSEQSAAAAEPLPGTAPHATRWLFVEQEGAYAGREAALTSGLPESAGRFLLDLCEANAAKLVLTRAAGRHPAQDRPSRHVWLMDARFPDTRAWTWTVPNVEALRNLTLTPPAAAVAVQTTTLMICSHAKRDVCCARLGLPLAETARELGMTAWATSHLGGHRFAPVALDLATGYAYGRLLPSDLPRLGAGVLARRARGHVGLGPAEQVADLLVRQRYGVAPRSITLRGMQADVTDDAGRHYRVALTERESAPSAESCGKPATTRPVLTGVVTRRP